LASLCFSKAVGRRTRAETLSHEIESRFDRVPYRVEIELGFDKSHPTVWIGMR
jgi:hypothetical protein